MDPTYYDDSSSDSGGGNFDAVLGAFTSLGQTAILASNQPSTSVPYPGPAGSYNAGGLYGAPPKPGPSMFTIGLLLVAGVFAYSKLK